MSQKVSRNVRMMDRQSGGHGPMGNPAEERRLAATLRKIDREKKKREAAMAWNQRSFFMKQVFDQDNELRFVKASQRPKYLECIPPPPPDGDNSWIKEEYVFSFKPKNRSPESRSTRGNRQYQEQSDEPLEEFKLDELVVEAEAEPEKVAEAESKMEVLKVKDENENEMKEEKKEETKEPEKRDAFQGMFGRRQKLNMPLLMTGAWKAKNEEEKIVEEEKPKVPKDEDDKPEKVEEKDGKLDNAEPEPVTLTKNSPEGQATPVKPRVKFPVLKVRALGLFAASFKKNDGFPPLASPRQSQPQPQSQPPSDTPSSNLPVALNVALTASPPEAASLPPQTAPANLNMPRPGSISLPNSPQIQRKPLVRQNSDHTMQVERPQTKKVARSPPAQDGECHQKSRRGPHRISSSLSLDKSKRKSSDKSCRSASSVPPKVNRNFSARPSLTGSTTTSSSSHSSGKESRNLLEKAASVEDSIDQGKAKKDLLGFVETDGRDDEEVDFKVIRRIVRTLPTDLMVKTSKREVEAGCDGAFLRQKLMDRARAGMSKRASLDPRFKNLEKSLTIPQT